MKVVFFVNEFPSLTQTFVLHQIAGTIDAGHDVTIIAERKKNIAEPSELVKKHSMLSKTIYLPSMPAPYWKRWSIFSLIRRMKIPVRRFGVILRAVNPLCLGKEAASLRLLYKCLPFLNHGSFDILHCQFGMLGQMVAKLKQTGVLTGKLITSFRGYDTQQYLKKHPGAYQGLFNSGDLFLPVTRSFKAWLIENGCPEEKIKVLHSGIDSLNIDYHARKKTNGQPIRLLSVCRLVEKKGMAYAISSVADFIRAGNDAQYTIIGEGPLRSTHQQQIESLGVSNKIHLPGSKPHKEVLELFQQSHIFLSPSVTAADGDMEGIPNVLKEAMASGMPVLATQHSGIPELVQNGVTGYLVPERDTGALTQGILDLATHPEKWELMGRTGRTVVKEEFDIQKLNKHLLGLYSNLLTEK